MAITFLQRRKIQKYLIPVFIVVILITIIVIWSGFLREDETIEPVKILIPPKKVEVDFEVLKSPILEELEPFEEISPFEEKIGRENPFISY